MIGSVLVLQRLEKMEVEVMYVDEFSFDPRKARLSGWGPASKKNFIRSAWDFRPMSFILGLSGSHYYGIMGQTTSIDSKNFMVYLSSLLEQFKNSENSNNMKLVIEGDNATTHTSNWISNFMAVAKIGIVPFDPIVLVWIRLRPIYLLSRRR